MGNCNNKNTSDSNNNNNNKMTVNAKNLTEGASKALARSRQIAIANNSMFAATEHCLAALIEQDNSPVTQLLQQVIASAGKSKEVVIGDLRVKVNSFIKSMKLPQSAAKFVNDHQSPSLGRAIQVAAFYCQKASSSVPVAEIHLLLGLLLTPEIDKVNNVAATMIAEWASCSTVETKAGEYDKIVGTFREAAKSASKIPSDLFDLSAAPPRYTAAKFGITETQISEKSIGVASASSFSGIPAPVQMQQQVISAAQCVIKPLVGKSHWVIPGKFALGKSAGSMSNEELVYLVESLGVNAFVCLQGSYNEYGCNDPRKSIANLISSKKITKIHGSEGKIRFLHCPIPDFGTVDDLSMVALVEELIKLVRETGVVVYTSCYGGHGRSGSVATNLLGALENVPPHEALRRLCERHKARGCHGCALNYGELEAEEQQDQAERLSKPMTRETKKHLSAMN